MEYESFDINRFGRDFINKQFISSALLTILAEKTIDKAVAEDNTENVIDENNVETVDAEITVEKEIAEDTVQTAIAEKEEQKLTSCIDTFLAAPLDAKKDAIVKKVISSVAVAAEEKGLLPKTEPEKIAASVDEGYNQMKLAFKAGKGEMAVIDAADKAIDYAAARTSAIVGIAMDKFGAKAINAACSFVECAIPQTRTVTPFIRANAKTIATVAKPIIQKGIKGVAKVAKAAAKKVIPAIISAGKSIVKSGVKFLSKLFG